MESKKQKAQSPRDRALFLCLKCSGAGAGQGLPGPWPDLLTRRGALRNARDRRHAGICVATIPGWAAEQDTPFRENHPANGKEGKKFSGPAPRSLSAGGLVCYNREDMTERLQRRGRSRLCRAFRERQRPFPAGGKFSASPRSGNGKAARRQTLPGPVAKAEPTVFGCKGGAKRKHKSRGFPESRGGSAGAKQVSRCL